MAWKKQDVPKSSSGTVSTLTMSLSFKKKFTSTARLASFYYIGYRQIRHAMSTLMIYILKPSNITVRTFKTTVKKLNFLMEGYTVNVNDFRKVCEEVLAKCAITHQMWEDLATDFERLIAGSDGAAKALKGRMTLPNLTSLKLILTVREKIPTFELDGFATQAGEQDRIIRMMAIANATPFVMVASDKADLVQHMKSTDIPRVSYVCKQLCEKVLNMESLAHLGCEWKLGDEKVLLDNLVNNFIANIPVNNNKYANLGAVALNNAIPALPSFAI